MTKFIYRGAQYDSEDIKPASPKHGDELRYRGVRYNGDAAEKDARAKGAPHQQIYRGQPVTRRQQG